MNPSNLGASRDTAEFIARCHAARIRLAEACKDPLPVRDAVLSDIMSANAESEFGKEHGFHSIKSMAEFKRRVPIRSYADLAPWIRRIAEGGKRVLTGDDPYMFLKTTGSTGSSKAIPQTRHWRMGYRGPAIYAQWGVHHKYHPYIFSHPHAVLDLSWERDDADETFGVLPFQAITHRPESLGETDWTPPWYTAPWMDFRGNPLSYQERLYLRFRHFIGKDLRAIVSVNPSTLIAMANHLSRSTERLIRDVHQGEYAGKRQFIPDPVLARGLESMAAAKGCLTPASVWKNLNLVVCWKSASAAMYLPQLADLFPDAEAMPFSTTGTEGVVTCPVDRHPTSGVLAITQGVYEFVPVREDEDSIPLGPDAETLDFRDLSIGGEYRLVMSQANGLYRYEVGDLYRAIDFHKGVPRLEFIGREGAFSSFTGEKLSEQQVVLSCRKAMGLSDLHSNMFTCCPVWGTPPRYVFIIEAPCPWPAGKVARLGEELDRQLGKANVEYIGKRASERLSGVEVEVVGAGAFQRYWDSRIAQGTAASQLKHRWLQKDDDILRRMRALEVPDFTERASTAMA